MKKTLFNLTLMLSACAAFAQQGKNASITAESVNSANGQGRIIQGNQSQRQALPAPTNTTATCMSINFPAPTTWTLASYGYGPGNGYVNGTNIYGDKEKATYYDASSSSFTKLNQVWVQFAKANGTNLNKVVSMVIYDGTSGSPGAAIGTSSMTLGDIKSDIAGGYYSSFVFPGGINIPASKKFFTSVNMSALTWTTTTKDSLAIVSNTNGQTLNPSPTWEKDVTNTWYQYNTAGATTASLSLVMFPFLTNTPSNVTFSLSANPICTGQSMTHDAAGTVFNSATSGDVLQWGFYGPVATTTLQTNLTSTKTYSAAGTYTTILEVIGGGCQVYDYLIRTFTVNPSPTVTATAPSTVCPGGNATLSGGGASTYTWTGGVTNGVAFAPAATSNYTVTGSAANGCTNTAVTSVLVDNPTVTANAAPGSICPGGSTTLTGGGASTYTWSSGVTNGVAFNPSSTATYTVTGGTVNGCTKTATVSVSVVSTLTVTANASAPAVCTGNNVTLNGGGASTYTWTGGVTNAAPFVPTGTGSYTVTGASGSCTGTAVVTVSVNPNPTVGATSSAPTVCSGNTVTLTGTGTASTYTWTSGVANGTAFTPSATNSYTVTGTNSGTGCSSTATISVNVNTTPTVAVTASSNAICIGSSVTLTGTGATTYTWTGGVNNGVAFSPSTSGTYTVTGSSNGCTSTPTAVAVNVNTVIPTVTASASSNTVCSGSNVTLTGGGATSYVWSGGVTNATPFIPASSGTYTVTGTTSGCTNTATVAITVNTCTGIKSVSAADVYLNVYPNPSNGEFTVAVTGLTEKLSIEIFNGLGEIVYKENLTSDKQTINANFANGVYFIKLIENGKVLSIKKMIKQ